MEDVLLRTDESVAFRMGSGASVEGTTILRKRIIAFDSWAQYSHYYERLVEALEERGFDLMLIHIGSWGHDLGRPKEERVGRLAVRDITYYGGMSFDEILELERPSAVLFLSMQAFAHRAFNRYCRQLGIPTVHLYHGIVRVQNIGSSYLSKVNLRGHMAMISGRLWKNVSRIWPAYARSLANTRASIRDWLWFAYVVLRQALGISYTGIAAPDASTTACCVFTQGDIDHAVTRYRLSRESVFAVGNPDLSRFGVLETDLGACLSSGWAPAKDVMYIDTGFVDVGLVYDNASDFLKHVVHTRQSLEQQGFHLVVKLHPAHFRTGMPQSLRENGIEVCENADFMVRLRNCCASIVEPTSLAVVPALMGAPLYLGMYGKLRNQRYGEVLTSYPRARLLPDIAQFGALQSALAVDLPGEKVAHWINLNSGPLPADRIPARIADIVSSLVPR